MARSRSRFKKHSRGRFILSMITYALVFLAVAGIGLRFLWSFLSEYEVTRPEYTMDSYIASLDDEHIRAIAENSTDYIDSAIQDNEGRFEYVRGLFEGDLAYKIDRSQGGTDSKTYAVFNGDELLGQVTIRQQPEGEYGLSRWAVTDENYDFSSHASTAEITVPSDWSVYCGNTLLGAEYIVGSADYKLLSEYISRLDNAPHMVTYRTGSVFGTQELYAVSPEGVRFDAEQMTDESIFTDNLTAEEMQVMQPFVEEYVKRYVTYTSGANELYRYNLQMLQEYLVMGSDFERRLDASLISMIHSHSMEDTVLRTEINHCMNVNEDYYVCDVSYDVRTLGNEGYYESTSNVILLIAKTEAGLLVDSMTGY